MRRVLIPVFAFVFAFGLAACGDAPSAATDAGSSNATGAPGATGAVGDATASHVTPGQAGEGGSCCDKVAEDGANHAVCVCEAGKAGAPVWCEACKKGFVDSKEVCCPKCVQKAIDKASAKAGGTE